MPLDQAQDKALTDALPTLSAFKRAFGRDLSADFLAALYVAQKLGLSLPARCTEPGCDGIDERTGKRYQVKHRTPTTLNIEVNDFAFDFLVLVNLNEDYSPGGMWLLPKERLQELCVARDKYLKHQITQARFKREAERIL